MTRYLVTGGAGFIGSHVVDALVARDAAVRVVDDLSTGRRENLARAPDVELVVGDLADPDVADRVVREVDRVVHLAAIASVHRSIEEPLATNRANITATLRLLEAARRHGVRRVVVASSSAVYGNRSSLPNREEMPPDPPSPYAVQKLTCELYARLFFQLHGLETVAIRYFNVFGERQDPSSPYSGVISLFARGLSERRRPVIHGDGEQTRDFTYVSDVVDGTLRACEAPEAAGRVVNLSRGARVSVNRLYRLMRDAAGSDLEPEHGPARPGEVRDSQGDITLARALLGYAPRVSLEDGLRRTLAWYARQG